MLTRMKNHTFCTENKNFLTVTYYWLEISIYTQRKMLFMMADYLHQEYRPQGENHPWGVLLKDHNPYLCKFRKNHNNLRTVRPTGVIGIERIQWRSQGSGPNVLDSSKLVQFSASYLIQEFLLINKTKNILQYCWYPEQLDTFSGYAIEPKTSRLPDSRSDLSATDRLYNEMKSICINDKKTHNT